MSDIHMIFWYSPTVLLCFCLVRVCVCVCHSPEALWVMLYQVHQSCSHRKNWNWWKSAHMLRTSHISSTNILCPALLCRWTPVLLHRSTNLILPLNIILVISVSSDSDSQMNQQEVLIKLLWHQMMMCCYGGVAKYDHHWFMLFPTQAINPWDTVLFPVMYCSVSKGIAGSLFMPAEILVIAAKIVGTIHSAQCLTAATGKAELASV